MICFICLPTAASGAISVLLCRAVNKQTYGPLNMAWRFNHTELRFLSRTIGIQVEDNYPVYLLVSCLCYATLPTSRRGRNSSCCAYHTCCPPQPVTVGDTTEGDGDAEGGAEADQQQRADHECYEQDAGS